MCSMQPTTTEHNSPKQSSVQGMQGNSDMPVQVPILPLMMLPVSLSVASPHSGNPAPHTHPSIVMRSPTGTPSGGMMGST